MPLLERITGLDDVSISQHRYDKVGAICELFDIVEVEDKPTKKGPRTVYTYLWKTTQPLQALGEQYVLAPGSILRQERWVDVQDTESIDGFKRDMKRISVAINKLPSNADGTPLVTKDDCNVGKYAYVYLTFKPSKEDPTDLNAGIQNFRISAVKE